jgi:hypothetical protein
MNPIDRVPPLLTRALVAAHGLLIAAVLLAATAFFAWWVNRFYPLEHWLFFRYLVVWLEVALFASASLSAGWRILRHLVAAHTETPERLTLAAGLGVLVFFGGTFIAGLLHLYGRLFFFVWPALMLAYGLPRFAADLLLRCRTSTSTIARAIAPRTIPQLAAAVLLIAGLLGLYLQILNPNQLGYDARWYHMPVAEFYVAAGGIEPFREGWYLGTYPQLTNLLYVWAFEGAGTLFDHVLLCTHLEYVLFLVTLLGVGVLAARLLRQDRLPYAAAVMFLFPQVFAYDSNLNGGADHVLAFWAPAVGITLVRLGSRFARREASLAGLMMAGALLTKYQAAYLLIPSLALVGVLLIRTRKWRVAVNYCAVVLLASSPHWAKNLVYYRDPFYPLLHAYLPLRPFHAGAAALMQDVYWPKVFSLQGTLGEKASATLQALVTFSFVPHDWPELHGMKPIFGSLFTLSLPLLLLTRATRQLWLLAIGVHLGIAAWFVLGHEDRFLQALVPWMAAATAGTMALAWKRGWLVRAALTVLVLFQWAWGLDVYFIRSHNMLGDSAIRATTEFLGAAHRGEYKAEQSLAPTQEAIAAALPSNAKVLFHRDRLRLGLGHWLVEDTPGWQGAIEYLQTDAPAATERLLRSLGVTHVMWTAQRGGLSHADVAREIVFARTLSEYFQQGKVIDGWHVGELRAKPLHRALANQPTRIAWLACDSDIDPGIYTPSGLAASKPRGERDVNLRQELSLLDLSSTNVAVTRSHCTTPGDLMNRLNESFGYVASIGGFTVLVRTRLSDDKTEPTTTSGSACGAD